MENLKGDESFFDKTTKEMEGKGFGYAGIESLATTKFINGLFTPVLVQTEEDIKSKYSKNGKYEVELILQPNQKIEEMLRKGIITEEEASKLEPPETDKSFLVFIKPRIIE